MTEPWRPAAPRWGPASIQTPGERIWHPDPNAMMREYMQMRIREEGRERDYLQARLALMRNFVARNRGKRDKYAVSLGVRTEGRQ
jgi:hypothetical protein